MTLKHFLYPSFVIAWAADFDLAPDRHRKQIEVSISPPILLICCLRFVVYFGSVFISGNDCHSRNIGFFIPSSTFGTPTNIHSGFVLTSTSIAPSFFMSSQHFFGDISFLYCWLFIFFPMLFQFLPRHNSPTDAKCTSANSKNWVSTIFIFVFAFSHSRSD